MPVFPNASNTLLKISSLFASPGWQAVERARFSRMELRRETYDEKARHLIERLQSALSLPEDSAQWRDAGLQIVSLISALDAYALHTATFGADRRQILWVVGREMAPSLGRTWGFWCRDEPIMPQLPEGNLWFLPRPDPDRSGRLILPVEVICRWWRGLLAGPVESIWPDAEDDRHRTFQTWLGGKATPTPAKLEDWFADDRQFTYRADLGERPEARTVRTLLLWARALETAWKDLVASLTPGVLPDEPDPMRNKALQLAELFRVAQHLTVAAPRDSWREADRVFRAGLPDWLATGDFWSILPEVDGSPPAAEEVAAKMTAQFRTLDPTAPLQDVFRDAAFDAPAAAVTAPAILADRQRLANILSDGWEAWLSRSENRAQSFAEALARARRSPRAADFEAEILHLEAQDALSKGNFAEARVILDHGRDLCADGGFGGVALEIARLGFALSVACEAFDQNRCEADFRIMSRSVAPDEAERWQIGRSPPEHSIRLAAVEASHHFWSEMLRPYPGVQIDVPLNESEPIFRDFSALLYKGADEPELRSFLEQHRPQLKRKLRDVRGDTFLTMITKMVPDLAAGRRIMAVYNGLPGSPDIPALKIAGQMRETYLRFVRLLPTDVLSARDFRGQTALMLAADRKDSELLEILIGRNVDIDAQDTLGRTALHSAAKSNALDCFDRLLIAGANPMIPTFEGKTAGVFAAEFGHAQIFLRRLADRTHAVAKDELRAAYKIAERNEERYKVTRREYRQRGVEVGDRSAFKEIMAACRVRT